MCPGAVLVVLGSRRWVDAGRVAAVCSPLVAGFSAVWSSDCRGACAAARAMLPVSRVWAADWSRGGRSAGFRRSAEMLAACPRGSLVVLFVPGGVAGLASSPGSAFEARRGLSLGLSVLVVGELSATWLPSDPWACARLFAA